jgi:uncharacterized protein YdeI (YjbR/CyaY-like superfamily)
MEEVENYFSKNGTWKEALNTLRKMVLALPLDETLKWGAPFYTFGGKQVVGLAAFKSYVALWFPQGSLLKDLHKKLINAQEGITKGNRQWRFQSLQEIEENQMLIVEYINESISNLKQGLSVKPQQKKLVMPKELGDLLANNAILRTNFEAFTNFKKNEFMEYISEAKREVTRQSRLEKIISLIQKGEGLNDIYRK